MAKIELNPVFSGFSKKMGNLVFFERNGVLVVREHVVPRDPKTPAQRAVRAAFRTLIACWKGLDAERRGSWNAHARKGRMTGYNLFLKRNLARVREGLAPEILPPGGGSK